MTFNFRIMNGIIGVVIVGVSCVFLVASSAIRDTNGHDKRTKEKVSSADECKRLLVGALDR